MCFAAPQCSPQICSKMGLQLLCFLDNSTSTVELKIAERPEVLLFATCIFADTLNKLNSAKLSLLEVEAISIFIVFELQNEVPEMLHACCN